MSTINTKGLIDMYALQINANIAAPLSNDVFNPQGKTDDFSNKCAQLRDYISQVQSAASSILAEIPLQ
jgi:hypothetical protein